MFLHLKGRVFDSADLRTAGKRLHLRAWHLFSKHTQCVLYVTHHHPQSTLLFCIICDCTVLILCFHMSLLVHVLWSCAVLCSCVCVCNRWLPQAHCHNWSFSPAKGYRDQGNAGSVFELRDNRKLEEGRPQWCVAQHSTHTWAAFIAASLDVNPKKPYF